LEKTVKTKNTQDFITLDVFKSASIQNSTVPENEIK